MSRDRYRPAIYGLRALAVLAVVVFHLKQFPAFFTVALTTLIGASLVYSKQDLPSVGASLTATALFVATF